MTVICQSKMPEDMRVPRALPGIQPLEMKNWLVVDEVYGAQMQERLRLMSAIPNKVRAQISGAQEAVQEALDLVLHQLEGMAGFTRKDGAIVCPDGREVSVSGDPLMVLGALIQEDICILERAQGADEHILSAAILCFPSHWTLGEKIGKPMGRIHAPVEEYDENIRRRVQRLCDGVQVGRPLWRFNYGQAGPELYQPRLEADIRVKHTTGDRNYQRAERQSLLRLPRSNAVLFSIHTYVVPV
ncbi:MAG: DUF3445 domain-containing protein [Planktotalea sp.]|uniref:heme-dependent oxidative N-demethylase family protein n=1 Tax=Planktotalea sp. TaxID=2029877 RepID=UPI003C70CC89